jgi:cyclopropane fatty-acyl-phospholipid synthase-like methyltransferase
MTGRIDDYVMGRSAAETDRLQLQGAVLASHTEYLLRLAGIAPGMRVLDVGCGPGDVSMAVARLVGPAGAVIGVDMDPNVLDVARVRAENAGLTNISYVESDLAGLLLDEPVDALTGRLILMHLKEPAAIVRALSRSVRSGGIVSFQDYDMARSRSVPQIPLVARCTEWIGQAIRAGGGNPAIGEQIPSILRDAGLSVEGAASVRPGGTADSVLVAYLADTLAGVLPVLVRYGLVTEAEVGIDTLTGRLTREVRQAGATLWTPELAAAWARVA